MPAFSGEFWAAIAGALVGGGISALLQLLANRSARKDRKADELTQAKAHARSLLFKVIKIESDFLRFHDHALECRQRASETEMQFGWASFIALANVPRSITFTSEEMAALVRCKDDNLFNDVLSFDEIHSSVLQLMTLYRNKRMELSESLPAEMEGTIGSISLSQEQYRAAAPRMTELDLLANDIADLVGKEASVPMAISNRLVGAFNLTFGGNLSLELKTRPDSSVANLDV